VTDDTRHPSPLRSPTTWAATCGVALVVALVLPPAAPDLLFWGAALVSCAGAAGWVIASQAPGG
jgi:hypothetical protein